MKNIVNCKLQIANCKLSICRLHSGFWTCVGLLLVVVLTASVGIGGARITGTGSKSDLAKLQGSWRVVAGESRGKPKPEDALKDLKWVVKGHTITLKGDEGKNFVLRFQIDATKKPKTINLTNPERKETVQGIYQLDKDRWKLCVGVPGEKRPAAFVTRQDLNVALFVLEKEK